MQTTPIPHQNQMQRRQCLISGDFSGLSASPIASSPKYFTSPITENKEQKANNHMY